MAKLTAQVKRQIEYALFLAAGQDDPHSVTITELCASLSRLTADNEALREALGRIDNGYGSDHLSKFCKDVARAALGDRP